MTGLKDLMLETIVHNSNALMANLADEFVHAPAEEKEAIASGIDFERWLATVCQECLVKTEKSEDRISLTISHRFGFLIIFP